MRSPEDVEAFAAVVEEFAHAALHSTRRCAMCAVGSDRAEVPRWSAAIAAEAADARRSMVTATPAVTARPTPTGARAVVIIVIGLVFLVGGIYQFTRRRIPDGA